MRHRYFIIFILFMIIPLSSCKQKENAAEINVIFLHHSTGGVIWRGTKPSLAKKAVRRVSGKLGEIIGAKDHLPLLFDKYNKEYDKNYKISELFFPKASPYGWNNDPYDYYNIWVKNAGEEPFMEEPTLEMLTKENQVIIFKHCYPVNNIQADQDSADINSDVRTLSNYKLQYSALRDKLHTFPDTKFILFTGAAIVEANITEVEAIRANEFFDWVRNEWDLPDDNIFIWDLYSLETEGSLYLKNEFAVSVTDSHINKEFAGNVVKLLFNRIIDVIENNGNSTQLTGKER